MKDESKVKVPFVDLRAQYVSIQAEIDDAIASVVRDTAFVGGPYIGIFERSFAYYCGNRFAIGVSSGTDALRLALVACGVGPGDEVITVPNTFIATTEAITMVGAETRFVDVTPGTFVMDPELLDGAITEKTRAIIPVHLYGRPADMDPILEIARKRNLKVVADAAQAHGALYNGRKIGAFGNVVCFSFYPGKNLGAYGDAGAVVTDDPEIMDRIVKLRDHGRTQKYEHEIEGFSCRLDGLQAAILSAKLSHLETWTKQRLQHARLYSDLLETIPGVSTPPEDCNSRSVHHLYVIRVKDRARVQAYLSANGIATGIHYPIPLHLQPAYAHLGFTEGSFPVCEDQARTILSLPMYAELSEEQVKFVVTKIREVMCADERTA